MYQIGNSESGYFSYVQTLQIVGRNIKDYQKGRHRYKQSILRHKI